MAVYKVIFGETAYANLKNLWIKKVIKSNGGRKANEHKKKASKMTSKKTSFTLKKLKTKKKYYVIVISCHPIMLMYDKETETKERDILKTLLTS